MNGQINLTDGLRIDRIEWKAETVEVPNDGLTRSYKPTGWVSAAIADHAGNRVEVHDVDLHRAVGAALRALAIWETRNGIDIASALEPDYSGWSIQLGTSPAGPFPKLSARYRRRPAS